MPKNPQQSRRKIIHEEMQGESLNMTDQQIVTALINRDEEVTRIEI